jgi:predicted acylesterase/phospholipase RssA
MGDTLVVGSGGIKGFAFLGVCKMLESKGVLSSISRFIGCSIGSVVCLGLVCGYTCSELLSEFLNRDFEEVMERGSLEDMVSKMGIFNKSRLRIFLKEIVEKKMGIIDAEKMTFKDLYELTDKELYCITTNIDTYSPQIYGYLHTPQDLCIECVMTSCSIPFVFEGTEVPKGFLVDGAIMDPIGLKVAFEVTPPPATVYASFFVFQNLAMKILTDLQGSVPPGLEELWKKATDTSPPPLEHSKAKESGLIVNILSHGQRLYQSYMESLVENYVYKHIYENRLKPIPLRLMLFPLPNFNSNVNASPETKVHMYFTGGDVTRAIYDHYGKG